VKTLKMAQGSGEAVADSSAEQVEGGMSNAWGPVGRRAGKERKHTH
jgi:hypothetical protein